MVRPSSAALAGFFDGVNAIYSFGDSLADTGNLIREVNNSFSFAISHLPYGETTLIIFKEPTGRATDGLLIIDYFALALRLPFVQPYLEKDGDFTHGINFAVGGATALDSSFFEEKGLVLFTNSSLGVQLQWFKAYLKSICSSSAECTHKLANTLFLLGEIGGNDYNYPLLEGKSLQETTGYLPYVVKRIIDAAEEVVEAGAVKIVIPGNFPIGCLPIYLTVYKTPNQEAYDEHGCLKSLNKFAKLHNKVLIKGIKALRVTYQHATFVYADYYNAFMHLITNAASLGFDENLLLKSCCGIGGEYNYNASQTCGAPGVPVCQNPAKQISWDGLHLTQEAYKDIAQTLISGEYTEPKLYECVENKE
ncbi:hypothetical protein HPP92_022557 [Vanilla planifolia]|uniref:Uncharacterized protein n=1 Tax=Vanilla planifolia TaxID=51239 RepID=A0A835PNS0_VANPL|nr:hypothetical protein HPP92_022557 [Vanilla planifolia]